MLSGRSDWRQAELARKTHQCPQGSSADVDPRDEHVRCFPVSGNSAGFSDEPFDTASSSSPMMENAFCILVANIFSSRRLRLNRKRPLSATSRYSS
jgi:hypothetical protein